MKRTTSGTLSLSVLATALLLLLSAATVRGDYKSTVLADSPIGYWRLDDSGATAVNSGSLGATGNGTYHGTYYEGRAGALAGDSDTAAGFDGSSSYISVPYSAALNPTVFTVECWASPYQQNPGNYLGVLGAKINSPVEGFILYLPPNGTQAQWQFWTGNGASWNTQSGALANGANYAHLVGTYDGTNAAFYVNGALYARSKMTYVPNPSGALQIGLNGTSSYYFKSNLDEVAIYGTALSPNQVLNHYVAARNANPPPVTPAILTAPQSTTNYLATSATFSVWASGSLPFTNQWIFQGTNSANAWTNVFNSTNNTFTVTNIALANAGNYAVVVSNNAGVVTSAVAALTVINIQSPAITPQPLAQTLYAGGTAHLISGATGGGNLAYQWLFYGTNLSGATGATLFLTNVQAANAGTYQLRATNEAGTNLSSPATVTVLAAPDSGTYAGYVMADQPLAYWRLDETTGSTAALDRAGGYNGTYVGPVALQQAGALVADTDTAAAFTASSATKVSVPFNAAINPAQFTLECWAKDNGSSTSDYRSPFTSRQDSPQKGFTFYATPAPGNLWQLWDGTGSAWDVITGPAVQFNNWAHLVATFDGTTKRFYVNGVQVGSSTGAYAANPLNALKIGAGGGSADSYLFNGGIDEVAVYGTALSAARVAAHYAMGLGATNPPSFTTQPSSGTVLLGSNITLSAQAAGSLPLSYQWQFYGTNLPGQTASTLTLNTVQSVNAGPYRLLANNPAGSVTSIVATVTAVTPTSAYSSAVQTDGAVGYWRLDETSGTTAANLGSLGSGINGAYNNGVTLGQPGAIAGNADASAGFTATNLTTVEVPYAAQLNGAQFTVECWAQMTGPGRDPSLDENYQSPLTSRNTTTAGYVFYGIPGGSWQLWTGTGSTYDQITGPAVRLGIWAHLAATYDGAVKRFYVNGVQVGSSTAAFVRDTATLLRIGGGKTESSPGAYFFQGKVDEVAVYTNALPAASLQAHYAIGVAGDTPPASPGASASTLQNQPLVLSVAKLLARASDPDSGDTLSVTAAGPASAQGPANNVVLSSSAGTLTYTPATDYTGTDTFTYTISDSHGATVTPTVTVTVNPGSGAAPNIVSAPTYDSASGTFHVTFAGVPGFGYRVQTATNLGGPWSLLETATAGTNGLFEVIDTQSPPPPARYYRTVYP